MIDEAEARTRVVSAIQPPGGWEEVPLMEALDRWLAADVLASVDLPGFDNSAMDGYAVRAGEAKAGARLQVSGEQAAGKDLGLVLEKGEAIRIFTGAPIPSGADAVIMQEDTRRAEDGMAVEIVEEVESGEWIRRLGSDVCMGQRLLRAGVPISPAVAGLLASQGMSQVRVVKRPHVGIVTTGDEVVEPGMVLSPGHLYNSNGPMLEALARQAGASVSRWHAPDHPGELSRTLAGSLDQCDFTIVAGGVSVGERDYVKECLAALGVTADFWRVRIKPGKPFLFGTRAGDRPAYAFGLPGNPVSAFVTWHLFAGPAIARWMGRPAGELGLVLPRIQAVADRPMENPGDRPHYVRVRLDAATGALIPAGLQRSDALFGLSQADALLRLEAGQRIEAGELVTAWRI